MHCACRSGWQAGSGFLLFYTQSDTSRSHRKAFNGRCHVSVISTITRSNSLWEKRPARFYLSTEITQSLLSTKGWFNEYESHWGVGKTQYHFFRHQHYYFNSFKSKICFGICTLVQKICIELLPSSVKWQLCPRDGQLPLDCASPIADLNVRSAIFKGFV